MTSPAFKLNTLEHGHTITGFYGCKTNQYTPGPGAYDPFPFLNPPAQRTFRPSYLPDRQPGFINVAGRKPGPWRPEPMSLSRLQSEQPLVHYASATFWDFQGHRRRTSQSAPRGSVIQQTQMQQGMVDPRRSGSQMMSDFSMSSRMNRSEPSLAEGGGKSMSNTRGAGWRQEAA
eukprot:TRINITY_DN4100_c0_g1_i1.p1 TRINITY_DN4100_c0_g1~~TRINITY_DN4100_c0_g1_i1.p1  ORF type:complete len:174 (-),score=13.69 TRINITY_DN4100_c0_g1_i1:376-897(-)